MQITVFGASGKVGQKVVAMALANGYSVRAFVHSSNPFMTMPGVSTVQGDITDRTAAEKALRGSSAVISTLGSWHTKTKNVVSAGTAIIIPAMEQTGVTRIITLTGAGASWREDKPTWIDKLQHRLLKLAAPKILTDGEEHLHLLAASPLDWTTVRSPVMTKQASEKYRLSLGQAPLYATIPRDAVARCLVDQLKTTNYHRQAPVIGRA